MTLLVRRQEADAGQEVWTSEANYQTERQVALYFTSPKPKMVRRHSSTAVESGVEKVEHVAQVVLS